MDTGVHGAYWHSFSLLELNPIVRSSVQGNWSRVRSQSISPAEGLWISRPNMLLGNATRLPKRPLIALPNTLLDTLVSAHSRRDAQDFRRAARLWGPCARHAPVRQDA